MNVFAALRQRTPSSRPTRHRRPQWPAFMDGTPFRGDFGL
jgi:hypothetical protein